MREIFRYLLLTVGGPLLIILILSVGILGEFWKFSKIKTLDAPFRADSEISDDRITIPQIGVSAPLILSQHDPTAPWDDIRRDLENGVSLAPGLSRPGEEGTVWITGHSSDYAWRKGQYKTIFALLPLLKAGDEITVDWEGKRNIYRVTGSEVVHPKNLEAFKDRGGKTLTLMTCYPPLTTARRWLTYAEMSGE